uniref:Putative inositol-145-triphosphate 5-phosphatase synaptojanin inp51/inp52/inp53 family n=1 Tax=Panstrongylus lignarius TaxID=156445 RepID=A0A224XG18_9HEMI
MKVPILVLFTCATLASVYATEKNITVHVATWNVNEKKPKDTLIKLLEQQSEKDEERPDIVIVGLQEVTMNLGTAVANYFLGDKWSQKIDETLKPNNYIKVGTGTLLGMILNVYVKLQHAWSLDDIAVDRVMTGVAGLYGNKGGVIMKFRLHNQWFCIVNAHFHAHDQGLELRIQDYESINTARARFCNYPSDYVFWLGDLNFRIVENPNYPAEKILSIVKNKQYDELLENDQLKVTKRSGHVFKDCQEAPITFAPTFKLLVGEGEYNLERRPAWTDRVLFKSDNNKQITSILYRSMEIYKSSDHYPVQAQFKILVDTDKY